MMADTVKIRIPGEKQLELWELRDYTYPRGTKSKRVSNLSNTATLPSRVNPVTFVKCVHKRRPACVFAV
jgi:hypothetical protein